MTVNRAKIGILTALIVVFVLLLCLSATVIRNEVVGIRFTDPEDLPSHVETLSCDGWEAFTYDNASDFVETVFDGEDAYYYSLEADKTEQYSMEAWLTSPLLPVYPASYTLGLRFFSRQRESTPDSVTVYSSEDGVEFREEGTVLCYDTGSELSVWREDVVSLQGPVRYLRFVFTVYYSGEEATYVDNSGIYFDKSFTLTARPSVEQSADSYEVTFDESDFYYNGETQIPTYSVTSSTEDPYFVTTYVKRGEERTDPVAAGDYVLYAEVRDDANAIVKTATHPYSIRQQTIELDSYETVSNGRYVVLLDATFIDGAGRIVGMEEAGCARIYDITAEVNIAVTNPGFTAYAARLGRLTPDASTASYLYYLENKDVHLTYDGGEKKVGEALTVFSAYDFGTGEFTTVTASVSASYTQAGVPMEHAPTEVGTYGYRIEFGASAFEGTLTVDPKPITYASYVGPATLTKYYDGTAQVAADGVIVERFGTSDVDLTEREAGDALELAYDRVECARTLGKTYLVAKNARLVGADAGNYTVASELLVRVDALILPTALYWTDLTDENGEEVRFGTVTYDGTGRETSYTEPVYNGGTAVGIARRGDVALNLTGIGAGRVTYADVEATMDSADAGERTATFEIVNETLFDTYAPAITTGRAATVTVRRRTVEGTATAYTGCEKTYDGTTAAEPEITEVTFTSDPGIDGFATVVLTEPYETAYESAAFDAADVGERTVTVRGVRLVGYDAATHDVLKNYEITELTLTGRIYPKTVNLLTEYVRLYRGQEIPEPEMDDADAETRVAVYGTMEDALAERNALTAAERRTALGEYFIRVTLARDNYVLGGTGIIPLSITQASSRMDQAIGSAAFAGGAIPATITVASGGTMDFAAYSYSTVNGLRTDLPVVIAASGANTPTVKDGAVTFPAPGTYALTFSCAGNSYYNAAESVTVNVTAKVFRMTVHTEGMVWTVGEALPTAEELAGASILYDGRTMTARLDPSEGTLREGTNSYAYTVEPMDEYAVANVDYTIVGQAYEATNDGYVLTEDATYADGKTYYRITAERSDETDVTGLYEAVGDGYVLTEDTVADPGKEYYSLTAEPDEGVLSPDGYYEKDGWMYTAIPAGTRLSSEKTYYVFDRARAFYGKTDVRVSLYAEKPEIVAYLSGTMTLPYGQTELDIASVTAALAYEGVYPLPISYVREFDGTVRLLLAEESGETVVKTDVSGQAIPVGEYVVKAADAAAGEYEIAVESSDFLIRFEGAFTLRVVKSEIIVYAENTDKQYYTAAKTEEELRALLKIRGSVAEGDVDEILSGVSIAAPASKEAWVGDYNVVVSGNREVGSYLVTYRNGYLVVLPTPVTIIAEDGGHIYGNEPVSLDVRVVVQGSSAFRTEDVELIKTEVAAHTTVYADVQRLTDVGTYPVRYTYDGNETNFLVSFLDGYYVVSPADIAGVTYADQAVLYDGERHRPEVSYDPDVWRDLTVSYSSEYFVEPGVYRFTATIAKRNYNTLTLNATLTIGTLTLKSSSTTYNAVTLGLDKTAYENGLDPSAAPLLTKASALRTEEVTESLDQTLGKGKYELLAVYDVTVMLGGNAVELNDGTYTLTFSPADVEYSDTLEIYGYDRKGKYVKLEYTYADGAFTLQTSRLTGLSFVEEVKTEVNKTLIWIFVVVIAAVCLVLIGFLFGGGARRRRERRISRRRHHRWA